MNRQVMGLRRRARLRWTVISAVFAASVLFAAGAAEAQCGSVTYNATFNDPTFRDGVQSRNADLTGCSGMNNGGATFCSTMSAGAGQHYLRARGPVSQNGTDDFCVFNCNGGSCIIKVDLATGLPVELLNFTVQ